MIAIFMSKIILFAFTLGLCNRIKEDYYMQTRQILIEKLWQEWRV